MKLQKIQPYCQRRPAVTLCLVVQSVINVQFWLFQGLRLQHFASIAGQVCQIANILFPKGFSCVLHLLCIHVPNEELCSFLGEMRFEAAMLYSSLAFQYTHIRCSATLCSQQASSCRLETLEETWRYYSRGNIEIYTAYSWYFPSIPQAKPNTTQLYCQIASIAKSRDTQMTTAPNLQQQSLVYNRP